MIQVASGGSSSTKNSNPFVNTSNSLLKNQNQAVQSIKQNETATKVTNTVISYAGYVAPGGPIVKGIVGGLGTAAGTTDTWANNAASKTVNATIVNTGTSVGAQNAALGAPGYSLAQSAAKAVTSTYNGVVNSVNSAYNQFKDFVNPASYMPFR
ncbi:hypothetical protein [Cohnella candidum]|uniref:hypothetical protein n=1 Tax=Cohnella candidum TaxID=2674991 RepID=UPI0013DDCFC7|nr:hypothetical protein [Cohnella candidum]